MSIFSKLLKQQRSEQFKETSQEIDTQLEAEAKPISELPAKIRQEVLGWTGTNFYDGYIQDEYNSLFQWRVAYETYDEMYRSDSTIFKTLLAARLPILSAEWTIRPLQDEKWKIDKKDQEIAEFIEDNIYEYLDGWRELFLSQCLHFLRDGVAVFEKVYQIKDWKICIRKLWVRLPKSIEKRQTVDGEAGIMQSLPNIEAEQKEKTIQPSIPANKLLIFSYMQEGKNYAGMSVLRPVAKNWIAKKNLQNFELVGYERQFRWVRKVRVPSWLSWADKETYLDSVASFDAGNDNTIILPGTPDQYDFNFEVQELPQAQHIAEAIKRHDANIMDSMLAIFLKLWESERWSYGMSNSGMEFFYKWLKVVAKQICDVVNKYLIKELVDLNFPNVEHYPELTVWELGKIDINTLSQSIQRLAQAKTLTPDLQTEQRVRETVGMPNKAEEEYEEPQKKADEPKDDKFHECNHDPIFSQIASSIDSNVYFNDISSEELDNLKKKSFSKSKYNFRPLTFAEQKVDLEWLSKKIQEFEARFDDEFSVIAGKQKAKILEQIKKAVEKNDLEALSSIKAGSNKELEKLILDIRKEVFNYGKYTASTELWFEVPKTSQEIKAYMTLESRNMANKVVDVIESKSKEVVTQLVWRNNWSITALATATAVADVGEKLDGVLSKVQKSTNTLSVISSINIGRGVVYNQNVDKIYAYQYSAILDGRTTDRCLSLDGRVLKPGSPEVINYAPPQHNNCRSILVWILIDETFKPKITGVPQYIDPVRDINNAGDLKRPYIRKDSPAIWQIKDELKDRKEKLAQYEKDWSYPNRQEAHKKRIAQLEKALPK